MRVLHLVSSGGFYGAESAIVNLVRSQRKSGHEAVIGAFVNRSQASREIADVAASHGIPVEAILCNGRLDRNVVPTLVRKFDELNVDIVHTHGYKANTYVLAARKKAPKRLVATCHGWLHYTVAHRVYNVIDYFCLRQFDQTVAVSDKIAGILRDRGIREERIATIPNGIDLSPYQGAAPSLESLRKRSGLMVGLIGQLVPGKGQSQVFRAIPAILSKAPDTVFVFVGDGPSRSDYENEIRELGIEKHAFLLGKRSDMPGVYASLDAMILPSFAEGMPMSILEAMAASKAVIGTPVGDVPKLILHEKTGLMTTPGSVGDIAESLLRIVQDDSLRNQLGKNAFDWVQSNFTADAMAARYMNLYERVLQ